MRDLLDLVILTEHDLLAPRQLRTAARAVWSGRNGTTPPNCLPELPSSWPTRYEQLAHGHEVEARTYSQAVALVQSLWERMRAEE